MANHYADIKAPKTVQVRVDPALLRVQRDAILRDIEANLIRDRYGTREHVEALDGLVGMLDYMLDECLRDVPSRGVQLDLDGIYNEGSD